MEHPAAIGKYKLIDFLGGGMSQVYRAHDTVIDRTVVVKILTNDACADPEAKARFLQEARLAGNIQHENIVSVFDYGEHEGRPFIVMEYLKGQDLRHAIRNNQFDGLAHRIKVGLDIALALEHVHTKGIVHRDIKPENINMDPSGKVKLMDFGIAKTADLSLTKTGMAMGTPYYMAPEQVMGKPSTPQMDIYAYGLVLFEILTGSRSVNGETMETVFYQILNVPVDTQVMENAGVPPAVRAAILYCTAKKAEERAPNFGPVTSALRAVLGGTTGASIPVAPLGGTMMQPAQLPPTQASPMRPASTAQRPAIPQPMAHAPAPKRSMGPWIGLAALLLVAVGSATVWMLMNRPVPQIPGMFYIPAGQFLSGPENTPVQGKAFYIDETEVSNAEFAEYCRTAGCAVPVGDPSHPVVNITIAQARAYAKSKGKRLPTSQEWERAARGPGGLLFPWGDQMDASKANVADSGSKSLAPVRSFAGYPAFHMIGNAWEMVDGNVGPSQSAVDQFATLLTPPPTAQELWVNIRGGDFNQRLTPALAYDTASIPERYSSPQIGFRCARDVQ